MVKFADLTDQEVAQLRAKGKCFICKEVGHMSRNCPQNNTVKGNGGKKPPGVSTFSMNMSIIEEDNDTSSNSVISSMPVGFIGIVTSEMLKPTEAENW